MRIRAVSAILSLYATIAFCNPTSIKNIVENPEQFIGKKVSVTGYTQSMVMCTLIGCMPHRCSCNSCDGGIDIVNERGDTFGLNLIGYFNGESFKCHGDECTIYCGPVKDDKKYTIYGTIQKLGSYMHQFSYAICVDSFSLVEEDAANTFNDMEITIFDGFEKFIGVYDSTKNSGTWYKIVTAGSDKENLKIDTLASGKFTGAVINGKKCGKWQLWYSNGQMRMTGNFSNDNRDSKWEKWDSTGQKEWETEFTNGRFSGISKDWDKNGNIATEVNYSNEDTLSITNYSDNPRSQKTPQIGTGHTFNKVYTVYPDGKKKECTIYHINELLLTEKWFPNGILKQKIITSPVNAEYTYHNSGTIRDEVIKKDDGLNETKGYYRNGKLNYVGNMYGSTKYGEWLTYYPTGTLKSKLTYKDGKLHGISVYYNEKNDNEKKYINYSEGTPQTLWYEKSDIKSGPFITYTRFGALRSIENYTNGKVDRKININKKSCNSWEILDAITYVQQIYRKDSLVYIATDGGLYIFDTFGNYKKRFTTLHGLPSNDIVNVGVDAVNNLWITTPRNGIAVLKDSNWIVFDTLSRDVSGNERITMTYYKDSSVLIECDKNDVYKYKNGNFEKLKLPKVFNSIQKIMQDKYDNIWILADYSLYRYTKREFKEISPKIINYNIECEKEVFLDTSGILNILSTDSLYKFTGRSLAGYAIKNAKACKILKLTSNHNIPFAIDNQNNIFALENSAFSKIVTSSVDMRNSTFSAEKISGSTYWIGINNTIHIVTKNSSKRLQFPDGPAGIQFDCIAIDNGNNIWVGGSHLGASRFNGKSWQIYTEKDGLPINSISRIFPDYNSNVWLGTGWGLACYSNGKIINYSIDGSPAKKPTGPMCSDKDGNLIFSTGQELYKKSLDTQFVHLEQYDKLFFEREVNQLYKDRKARIWAASQGKVWLIENDKLTPFDAYDGIPDNTITDIAEDSEGNIWISTWDGLAKFCGDYWEQYNTLSGLFADWITSIDFDAKGEMWCGTRDNGLLHFDGKNYEVFNIDDGLPAAWVSDLVIDNRGKKWIATENGLSIYSGDGKHSNYLPW
jgi:ligand-binding sensor domain-containing protein/antitoxin component YwqK of YwqJK toxin-antitoxin module